MNSSTRRGQTGQGSFCRRGSKRAGIAATRLVPNTAALRLTGRVDLDKNRLHMLGMATLAKRLLILCLALAFVGGVTAQLMPISMAAPQMTVSADMDGGCAGPYSPCTGHMPNCLDHGGCISASVVPVLPATLAVPVEWTSLDYDLVSQAITEIFVEPELSPPIFAA